MVEKSEENFLRVIGAAGTREILQFLDGHETVHYKELDEFINTDTLNFRLRDFLRYNFAEHHVENETEFLQLVGGKGTKEVLQFICERGQVQYKEFDVSVSVPTLNNRLSRLLDFYLVEHHFQKKPQRKEWYEITEKGIKMSKYLEDLVKLIEE